MTQRIGIFGGTFDPVHSGHIASAQTLVDQLSLDTLYFMPCQQHPHHKHPGASPAQRVEMLDLALAGKAKLQVDDRELKREGLSYTVDSLQAIRSELGDDAVIVFILGTDAFASFHQWSRWQSLLSLANLAVIERAGQITAAEITEPVLKKLLSQSVPAINTPSGDLIQLALEPYVISSTALRSAFSYCNLNGQNDTQANAEEEIIQHYVPAPVVKYIDAHKLYRVYRESH